MLNKWKFRDHHPLNSRLKDYFFHFLSNLHDVQYYVFVFGTFFNFTHRWYQLFQESYPTNSHASLTLQLGIHSFLAISKGIFSIFLVSFIFSLSRFLVNNSGKVISNQNKSHLLKISFVNLSFLSMQIIKNSMGVETIKWQNSTFKVYVSNWTWK